MTKTRRRSLLVIGASLAVLLIVGWFARGAILPAAGRWLNVGGLPERADFVMLLTGDENTRPFAAAALVKTGWAPRLLFAQAKNSFGIDEHDERSCNEIIRRIMQQQGVPDDDFIALPGAAATTFDEAHALAAYLADHPAKRVLIVTNENHTRRARWVFSQVLPASVQIAMIGVPSDEFSLGEWWRTDKGSLQVPGEYLKFAFYWLCYRNAWLFAGVLAAIASLLLIIRHRRRSAARSALPDAAVSQPG